MKGFSPLSSFLGAPCPSVRPASAHNACFVAEASYMPEQPCKEAATRGTRLWHRPSVRGCDHVITNSVPLRRQGEVMFVVGGKRVFGWSMADTVGDVLYGRSKLYKNISGVKSEHILGTFFSSKPEFDATNFNSFSPHRHTHLTRLAFVRIPGDGFLFVCRTYLGATLSDC